MNRFFKFLSLLMAMVLLAFCWPRPHAHAITLREEEEMSREFLKVVGDHFEIINDSMANAYVREIGAKVLATVPSQPFNYQFHIVREDAALVPVLDEIARTAHDSGWKAGRVRWHCSSHEPNRHGRAISLSFFPIFRLDRGQLRRGLPVLGICIACLQWRER